MLSPVLDGFSVMRSRGAVALALLAAAMLAGCGGTASRPHRAAGESGPIRIALAGVRTLDPARAVTAQQTELDWALYTGLVTYRHASGEPGSELIPGVGAALPKVSDGGRLYTVTLRRGLRFSDGRALHASDVVATLERAIATRDSPVRPLLLAALDGARSFAGGQTTTISGIAGNDRTGVVTLRLRHADPGFDAVLAEPALGIVPAGTPVRTRPGHPPPGIGPYRLRDVRPGRSFVLARNPFWTPVPGIPAGQVDVEVTLSPDARANALAVLNDVLDVADPTQALPGRTLVELRRQGPGRARLVADGRPVAFLFLGTQRPPFDDPLAREGVIDGLGALTPARAGARTLSSACTVVPVVSGAPTPDGCPTPAMLGGALSVARSLVRRSGTAGARLIVWSPQTGPRRAWLRDEAAVLRSIGYAARVSTMANATYRSEITSLIPRPAPPRPGSHSSTVLPERARHAVKASKPPLASIAGVVGGRLAADVRAPTADALAVAVSPVMTLDQARRDHLATLAEQAVPELVSWRMQGSAVVIDPVEGLDITSLRLR